MKASRSKPQASPGKRGLASRLVATTLLTRVIDDQRNLDALCDLKHGVREFLSLDERDRSLARAIAVSALRHRTTIEFVLKKVLDRPPPKRARFLIHSLHVAVAQILFLDVPSNAAVDLAVTAIGGNQTSARFRNLSNAVLRRVASSIPERIPLSLLARVHLAFADSGMVALVVISPADRDLQSTHFLQLFVPISAIDED